MRPQFKLRGIQPNGGDVYQTLKLVCKEFFTFFGSPRDVSTATIVIVLASDILLVALPHTN